MIRRIVLELMLCALPTISNAAAFDSTAALAKARALRPSIVSGDAAALWREFAPSMRAAMKDSASFAVMSGSIANQLGALDSVWNEEVNALPQGFAVRTHARFAKVPVPMVVAMSFDGEGRVTRLALQPEEGAQKEWPSAFLDHQTKTTLHLPFAGEWNVVWGGRTIAQNYHAAIRSQRFAHDILIIKDGVTHQRDGKALADYYCYGQPILAPAAGTVVTAVDSLPDQLPGSMDPEHPAGNHVVIDHGNGEYSLIAHLQPRSLRVKAGARVRDGDRLGLCGNSGNTSEPHLHYHLMNGPAMPDADGLPVFFQDLLVDGKPVERAEILRGQKVRRAK